MGNEENTISKEDYDTLFEKLSEVEGMLESVPEVTKEDFDKMASVVDGLTESVEKLEPEIQKMAEAKKPDVVEKSTVDEMSKTIETLQKQVETIETMPMMKGMQETDGKEPEKYDVMKGIFHTAFPEAGGK